MGLKDKGLKPRTKTSILPSAEADGNAENVSDTETGTKDFTKNTLKSMAYMKPTAMLKPKATQKPAPMISPKTP